MLGYNAMSPGPTLRVRPGDELAVRLTNGLDQPTNLHTHGLRISPQGNSDNPFIRVEPGATFDYSFQIPTDHPAGTFWYHPHHHGTVADQVFGGLFGALIVERPDQSLGIPIAADRILLISDITLSNDGSVAQSGAMERAMGREGELILVNGQHQPAIDATPGVLQCWRIINACVSRVLRLRLQDHAMTEIARDGTYLPAPTSQPQVVLAPGNRCDVIVIPSAGRHQVIAEPFDRGGMGMMMTGGRGVPTAVATMHSDGSPATPPRLPDALPTENSRAGRTRRERRIDFRMSMRGMGSRGMAFTIDGRTFDANRDDQVVRLGDVEEWTITNSTPLAHPFHLHVWPFTVVATSDNTPSSGLLQDVVLIPPQGWARLRIPFTGFAGRSVYHCHILDHEDLGMMATVNVRP